MATKNIYGSKPEIRRIEKLLLLIDSALHPKKMNQAPKIIKGLELYLENIKENGSE